MEPRPLPPGGDAGDVASCLTWIRPRQAATRANRERARRNDVVGTSGCSTFEQLCIHHNKKKKKKNEIVSIIVIDIYKIYEKTASSSHVIFIDIPTKIRISIYPNTDE